MQGPSLPLAPLQSQPVLPPLPPLPLGFSKKCVVDPRPHYQRQNLMTLWDGKSMVDILSPKFDCGHQTYKFSRAMVELSCNQAAPFALVPGFSVNQRHNLNSLLTPEGRDLAGLIEVLIPEWLEQHKHYYLHPVLINMVKLAYEFDRGLGPRVLEPDVDGSIQSSCDKANQACLRFADRLRDPATAESIKAFMRNAQNRYASTQAVIQRSISKQSKVTLVRIGLYGVGGISFMKPIKGTQRDFNQLALEMQQRRKEWLNAIKDRYKRSLLDGVWRIEYSPHMGFELQVLLAFNGHRHKDEKFLREELGRRWLATRKSEDTSCWSQRIYQRKYGPQYWNLDHHLTREALQFTQELVLEFCFTDLYTRLRMPQGMRSFGRVCHQD